MVCLSTLAGSYGVPWWTSNSAERMITATSGCPWPVAAIQNSGTTSAPHTLRPRARSAPCERQASTATAASP